jgi:hypothetical protein
MNTLHVLRDKSLSCRTKLWPGLPRAATRYFGGVVEGHGSIMTEVTTDQTDTRAEADGRRMADATPVAFGLFAFALAMYGVRFVSVDVTTLTAGPTTVGLNYAVLVGAIAETVGGILAIIRGITYPAYVITTFGIWLFGFYLLVTSGAAQKDFTPDALAWYALVLVVPVAVMAVPAVVHRNVPFTIAFVALIALLLLLGLGYHSVQHALASSAQTHAAPQLDTAVNLLVASAWCAFAAALSLIWVFARDVYRAAGLLHPPSAAPAAH